MSMMPKFSKMMKTAAGVAAKKRVAPPGKGMVGPRSAAPAPGVGAKRAGKMPLKRPY